MKTWNDIEQANNAEILRWAETEPWAREMANCQQDPKWHAEGNVWTHTKMVCNELERLPEWSSLERKTQLKLLFAALFHDAGKPATTAMDQDSGRIRSLKHAFVGSAIARRQLRELRCELVTREEIVALVRYHGRPAYILEREKPADEVVGLSWQVNNRSLYLFALADTRGRLTIESQKPEENLHLWKLAAEECGCFDRPYPFANDHARFLYYRGRLTSLHYTPHEEFRCTVTLMSGLPGAGKDTWLARDRPALPIVSLDAIRESLDIDAADNQGTVIQAARERCREFMRAGANFAFNATNVTFQMRRRWIDLFADYGARIEIVYVEPDLAKILSQNKQRPEVVPEKVMLRLVEQLEVPTITEAHSLTITAE